MDILDNVCRDLVRFVQPGEVGLEPGWPLHRFRGVFQQGVPLEARQAHQPSCSSQHEHVETRPLQYSWPPELHRGQCRQIREASHEAVPDLADTAGFEIFPELLGSLCTGRLEPGGQRPTGTPGLPLPSSCLINFVYEANGYYYLQNKTGFESTATCTRGLGPSLPGCAVAQLALRPQRAYTATQISLSQVTEWSLHVVSKKPQVLIYLFLENVSNVFSSNQLQ